MVESILHFAVPFVSLRAVGLDWRKTLFACLVALTPDLDVFFHVHRSQSHSLVVLAAVAIPLLIATHNRRTARTLVLAGAFGVLTHLVLDFFQLALDSTDTPSLWPFLSQPQWISTALNLISSAQLTVTGTAMESFDQPILTAPGLIISLVLMTPSLALALRNRAASSVRKTGQAPPS